MKGRETPGGPEVRKEKDTRLIGVGTPGGTGNKDLY